MKMGWRCQVFAFDFGGWIRAAALAMGGDWHDLGGALSDSAITPVALQPLASIDNPALVFMTATACDFVLRLLSPRLSINRPTPDPSRNPAGGHS